MGFDLLRSVIGDWFSAFRHERQNAPKRRGGGATRAKRLRHEPLEDRRMLANVTVSNLNDVVNGNVTSIAALIATPGADGISLREAITAANADATADTIDFSVTGTITLENGELAIDKNLTITGPGMNLLTIDASGNDSTPSTKDGAGSRVFNVASEVTVSISDLTITGGDVGDNGGGIASEGYLTLDTVSVLDNAAVSLGPFHNTYGGGIYQYQGTIEIVDSIIDRNFATNDGGGVYILGTESAAVIGSRIGSVVDVDPNDPDDPTDDEYTPGDGNSTTYNAGGMLFAANGNAESSLVIESSEFVSNSAGSFAGTGGGGLYLLLNQYCEVSIRNSLFSGNDAYVGGGIWMVKSEVMEIEAEIKHVVLSDLRVEGNTAGIGGAAGMWIEQYGSDPINGSAIVIDRTTVANNTTDVGVATGNHDSSGGISVYVEDAPFRIQNSSIYGNVTDGIGGGLYIISANIDESVPEVTAYSEVINTTISRNSASSGGGVVSAGTVKFRHSTITENHAAPVGGPYTTTGGGFIANRLSGHPIEFGGDLLMILDHTIIGNNTHAPNDIDIGMRYAPDISYIGLDYQEPEEPIYSLNVAWSLIGDSTGPIAGGALTIIGASTDVFDELPDIGALRDNGGPTLTHAPLIVPDSNVVDAGNPALVRGEGDTPMYDQRGPGYVRTFGWYDREEEIIDIGAVELQTDPEPHCPPGDYNRNGIVDAADYSVWRDSLGASIQNGGLERAYEKGDGNGDGMVTQEDYMIWFDNFGSTCENLVTDEPAVLPGDYNEDGTVDLDDYDLWFTTFGSTTQLDADGNGNGIIDVADLEIWQEYRGTTTLETILGDFDENGVVDMNDLVLWEEEDPAADANGDMVVDQDDYDIWEENFGMMAAWIMPTLTGSGTGVPLDIPLHAPRVTEVTVSGSASTHDPYSFSGITGSGEQLRTVPVGGADTLHLTFSEEVLVTSTAFTLTRVGDGMTPVVEEFSYDLDTRTASWQFDDVLPAGQYLVQLADSVFDLDHDPLDGEFSNPWSLSDAAGTTSELPSGDGEAGGEFRFRFTLLAGDFNHDNSVDSADYTIWSANQSNQSPTQGQGDADGDGNVDSTDYGIWVGQFGLDYTNWLSYEPGMILVSTANDEDDADYSYGDVSLREAFDLAAAHAGHDTIVFRQDLFDSVLTLSLGQLVVDSNVTIAGPGADRLSISGNDASRVFKINSGVEATIQDLTVTAGYAASANGGGIHNQGNLELDEVVVYDNQAGQSGGGIYTTTGTLTLINSTIDANYAAAHGGGVYALSAGGAAVTVLGSTISRNETSGAGGGLHVWGGGAGVHTDGALTVVNSTFSGNEAGTYGGGIRSQWQDGYKLVNTTITENNAGSDGGGISHPSGTQPVIQNTIIAENTVADNLNHSLANVFSVSFSGASSNNRIATEADLAPLGNYGGLTETHAPLVGSAAIDGGSDALALGLDSKPLVFDQRGGGFSRFAGDAVDIGAFEFGAPITVSTLADENDGSYAPGDLSLREAIALAAVIPGDDTIAFDGRLLSEPSSIVLDSELSIETTVSIDGPGADRLTIDADGNGRAFFVDTGASATISGLRITGGSANFGGGIFTQGALTVIASQIDGNEAIYNGGGIYRQEASSGSLLIKDSTIANNTSHVIGGGIYLEYTNESTVIANSTISSNEGGDYAGGIYILSPNVHVINSTVTNNHASTGGGIATFWTAELHNSIVANNTASNSPDLYGTFDSDSSYNLIGFDASLTNGINDGANANLVGGEGIDPAIDPGLAPLDDYGGSTKTHALLYGSPAIDAGDDAVAAAFGLLYDQRGRERTDDGDYDDDPFVDMGAFEVAVDEYFGSV